MLGVNYLKDYDLTIITITGKYVNFYYGEPNLDSTLEYAKNPESIDELMIALGARHEILV